MIPCVCGKTGEPLKLTGSAYDFGHSIAAVQFSLDGGENWTTYPTENTTDYQNVTWSFEFTPEVSGVYMMQVRAVNDRNEASPESAYVEMRIS